MFIKLNPPPDVKAQREDEVESARARFREHKAKLNQARRKKLERLVRKHVEEWERSTSGLQARLRTLLEFHEGKGEAVDFPFGPDASSNIDVRLAAGYGRLLRAQFIRAAFSDPASAYLAAPTPEVLRETLNEVERGVNWAADVETNFNECLKDSWIPAYRDGTTILHGRWETRIERGYEYRGYASLEEFEADYPDAKSAGVSEARYQDAVDFLTTLQAEGSTLRVEYQTDFVAKNDATFTLCPLAKFIWAPLYPQDLRRMTVYGFHYDESGAEFEQAVRDGYYDEKPAEECRKKTGSLTRSSEMDGWEESRDNLDGIDSGGSEEVSYRIARLCVKADLDEDGVEERYVVLYDLDKHRALRVEDYALPRNVPNMVPFRLVRKEGRFLGGSLMQDAEPIFRSINALHRHRSNTRRITDSVTLIIAEGLKNSPTFDLGAEYGSFIPGRALYVPNDFMTPNLRPAQLVVQGTSKTNESVDEEAFLQRYLDLLIGATPGQSGRESPIDPTAPASKTAMLLSRGDMRTEDLIEEWRRTIPDATELLRALYQANAAGDLKVVTKQGDEIRSQKVRLAAFADPRIRCVLKPLKQANMPEAGMQKIAALAAGAMQFMLPVRAKPSILIELWNDYVAESRVERPERFQIELQAPGGGMMMGGNTPIDPMMLEQVITELAAGKGAGGEGAKKPAAGGKAPSSAKKNGASGPDGVAQIAAFLRG